MHGNEEANGAEWWPIWGSTARVRLVRLLSDIVGPFNGEDMGRWLTKGSIYATFVLGGRMVEVLSERQGSFEISMDLSDDS